MPKNEVTELNEMYKRIEALCKERKINMTQMCRDTQIPRGNLTDLKMGRTKKLSTETLGKIAVYFGVSMEYLLGHENKKTPTLPEGERDYQSIMEAFEKADESTREAILLLLKLK